jgi:hypothetical protein
VIPTGKQKNEWIETIEDYVGKAREALKVEGLAELRKGIPSSACGCLLAANVPAVWRAMPTYLEMDTPEVAQKLVEAWDTELRNSHSSIMIPLDLQLAVAAFDCGLIPEMIDAEMSSGPECWSDLDWSDLGEFELDRTFLERIGLPVGA